MRKSVVRFLAMAVMGAAMVARTQAAAPVEKVDVGAGRNVGFNDGWMFFKGDVAAAREGTFDDAAWRVVDVPHDWSVEADFDRTLASCTAFLPCGVGWYRKHFAVPAEAKGKEVSIRFDGVMNHSTVYCNGKEVGGRPYGYSSFTVDLTPAIHFGGENVISVRVDHEQYADSRWYAGSGIYRNVWLNVLDPVHVETSGTSVTTPEISATAATVRVGTTVRNDGTENAEVVVTSEIHDAAGKLMAYSNRPQTIAAHQTADVPASMEVANPQLWTVGKSVLYRVHTTVKKGETILDQYDTPFGIRSFKFDSAKGFSINGETMKIKGVCLHHDAGALGAAVPIQVWETRLKLLQAAGVNAIRCSHNPPDPAVLDLYDRMGFLVMDEAFDEWTGGKHKWIVAHNQGTPGTDGYHSDFDKWADIDIKDMVLRDRNHPSIIMWSIGNEIDYTNDPWPVNSPALPPIAARLIADVKAVDTTRPVTAACAFPATNLYKGLLDIEGYNYMERLYVGDHAANPGRVIYGSENSHALNTWQAVSQNEFIAGQFLWTGADYLGEAGAWPQHGSGAGFITLANFPKAQYYFRQSLWSDKPMVRLSTTGVGGGRGRGAGAGAGGITCFTNCDSVELFQDGVSVGSQNHAPDQTLTFPVQWTGTLKAVGKNGGKEVASFEMKRPGAAAKLVLVSDVKTLKADGHDVAQIELDVTDKDGTVVTNGDGVVTCSVSGPGRVIGMENGNLGDAENYKALMHSTYQGRLMIYVQAGREAGEIRLKVTGSGVEAGEVGVGVR